MSPRSLPQLTELIQRVVDLERRTSRMVLSGPVTDVDEEKHRVRLRIGGTDDEPMKSPWIPYAQIAGALKLHSMPSVGQQMTAIFPDGVEDQGLAIPMIWSDQNQSPSKKKDEHVLTFENVKFTLKKDLVEIKVGNTVLKIKAGGIEATAADYDWKQG